MSGTLHLTPDEKTYGMLAHLSALAVFVLPTIGHIVGPLVIWLIKKDQSPWIDQQGKNALNFQISITLYGIVCGILVIILIGFLLLAVLGVFWLVMVIMAAVQVNDGKDFQYPLTIRFIT